jgi:ADP-dependent NAD(P)H-hydrate dehydratase / NAD(P)H-hydrate epimerase
MPAPRRSVTRPGAASPAGESGSAGAHGPGSGPASASGRAPIPASGRAPTPAALDPNVPGPLPADDATLFGLSLEGLAARWERSMDAGPIGAEAMSGADRRAQAMGVPGTRLMENAGCAVAAAVKALAVKTGRWDKGPVLILSGPGNNGGDGFVAARHLSRQGARVVAVLVATEGRPTGKDAALNWDRLAAEKNLERIHASVSRDLAILGQGVEKAAVVVDALLGTGVQGPLRDPIRSAVELIGRARMAGVPILAVDTPTAVNLTSGDLSDPVVQAHVTVTFHRPKTGLLARRGSAVAGRVLVAPIGIPQDADRG